MTTKERAAVDARAQFCIGVNRDYDVLLRSVLNKSVNSLTRAEVVSITNKYINLGTQKFSLVRLAYQYPPVIVLTYLCVVAAIICIRLVLRSRRFRAEAEKALHKRRGSQCAKTEFCRICPTISARLSTALWVCWTLPRKILTIKHVSRTA